MHSYLIASFAAAILVVEGAPKQGVDLYTATLLHERLSAICREHGLRAGYGGHMAWTGWPIGLRPGPPDGTSSYTWDVTSDQKEVRSADRMWVLLRAIVSPDPHPEDLTACIVNGKQLHVRIGHVHQARSVDDPFPEWALNKKGKEAGLTVRKLLQRLEDKSATPLKFKGKKEDAEGIDLQPINLFHHRLAAVANGSALLCVYYRGPMGRHPARGRRGFRLPETTNPALTWTITCLDDTFEDKQHLVCQIEVSLTKQPGSAGTYNAGGKTLYLSASHILGGRTVDEKIPELSRGDKGGVSLRALLAEVGR